MGLIPTQGSACLLLQVLPMGFELPVIEALGNSQAEGGSLSTAPNLVVEKII